MNHDPSGWGRYFCADLQILAIVVSLISSHAPGENNTVTWFTHVAACSAGLAFIRCLPSDLLLGLVFLLGFGLLSYTEMN